MRCGEGMQRAATRRPAAREGGVQGNDVFFFLGLAKCTNKTLQQLECSAVGVGLGNVCFPGCLI